MRTAGSSTRNAKGMRHSTQPGVNNFSAYHINGTWLSDNLTTLIPPTDSWRPSLNPAGQALYVS